MYDKMLCPNTGNLTITYGIWGTDDFSETLALHHLSSIKACQFPVSAAC